MSLKKAAEMDGREVWLAVMDSPEEARTWAAASKLCGVLVFLDQDSWDAEQMDIFAAAVLAHGPSEVAVAGEAGSDLEAAFEQELALHPPAAPPSISSHPDKSLDEAVWYMFYATIPALPPGEPRQPPLIVVFADGDPRIARFKSLAERFPAAMRDVLESE